jgi:hypothetical protein
VAVPGEGVAAGAAAEAPTAAPQLWQKRAPGVRRAVQALHTASRTATPHSEQNFPAVGAPHAGQVIIWFD